MDMGRNTASPLKLAIWALAKGLLLALVSLALAVPVVGMGHGWTGHMPFAQAGFLLFPLAFLRLSIDAQSTGWKTDAGAMALLLALFAAIPLVMIVANGMPEFAIHQLWRIRAFAGVHCRSFRRVCFIIARSNSAHYGAMSSC